MLEHKELGGWFRKVQDPILLEFLKVWGRIEVERQESGQVIDDLRNKYNRLKHQFSDLKGYLAEVYMDQILLNTQRQKLPGHYFHQKNEIEMPLFSFVRLRERLGPGAGTEIDVHGAAGIEQWVAESKWWQDRKVGISEIKKLLSLAQLVKTDRNADLVCAWFFSHDGFTEEAEIFMQEKGVFWSDRADLDGLLKYVKLRKLPKF